MGIHWCIKKFQKKVITKTSEIYSKNKKKIILFNKNSFTIFYLFFISKVNENNKWIILLKIELKLII